MILRTRGLVVTVSLAAFSAGAAALATDKYILLIGIGFVHISLAIVGFALALLTGFLVLDIGYYHRLLIATVEYAEKIENDFDLPVKQTITLSANVTRWSSTIILLLYYGVPLLIGIVIMGFGIKNLQPWLGP